MSRKIKTSIAFVFLLFFSATSQQQSNNSKFLSFEVEASNIRFYWKDDTGRIFRSIQNLKSHLESKHKVLRFAMNGGMYMENNAPLGLYIEKSRTLKKLNTANGKANFYLKPNGIFYITKDYKAKVCETKELVDTAKISFATQSGPMLVIDGEIHPAFTKGSANLNVRNGVGILPNNKVVFVMSKEPVNFYDFAEYFKNLGCKNALYLDGFVSRTYLPEEKWEQLDGNFGVIIGVTK